MDGNVILHVYYDFNEFNQHDFTNVLDYLVISFKTFLNDCLDCAIRHSGTKLIIMKLNLTDCIRRDFIRWSHLMLLIR